MASSATPDGEISFVQLQTVAGIKSGLPVRSKRESLSLSRGLVTYRDSDGRQSAVDGQLHPVHEARIV
jgi:hypothetical protein